jgi:hypothetical protein
MELVGTVICLQLFQCFNLPLGGLVMVQMLMCILMLLYFLLTRSPRFICGDRELVIYFCSLCWYDRFEVNFEKDCAAEKHATYPFYQQKSS